MNPITPLVQDHRNVEDLFKRFEALGPGGDPAEKRRIVDKVIEHLSVHAEVEEQVLYPALRDALDEPSEVLEGLEEHHLAKLALWELERLPAGHERFDAKVTVLMENVRHHMAEEEQDGGLFDRCRASFGAEELDRLGQRMEAVRRTAPNRPHPFSPDVPPYNTLIGIPVAVVDRAISVGKDVVGRVANRGRPAA
jgi:hypothetical protein